MEDVTKYKDTLRELVTEHGLQDKLRWENYEKLHEFITVDVLKDAVESMDIFKTMLLPLKEEFPSCELAFRPRAKGMERVQRKRETCEPFKVVNDFAAMRVIPAISCWPSRVMYDVRRWIIGVVEKKEGGVYGCKVVDEDDLYDGVTKVSKDITDVLYVYLPEVGHVIECQILHPFAEYVFVYNSAKRNKFFKRLFEEGLYGKVKDCILKKDETKNRIGHEDFEDELIRIEGKDAVEDEHGRLVQILQEIQRAGAANGGG
eukprot:Plantae.Rhodophyta-Hildenbrandia_rubra.ctg844.p2 GENE.Plantae.Rhodophyta-Hildenbrandia_rubra.ctg844~~Plantae.Rhodophyta-Hildenbrandia_rubra.ctg844.p2  ORF type:complete len:260 (+),score=68.23 Plantae.Rhodophyta-Hildenbrandia_rubra.ctg844:2777-3556(+)